MSIDPTTGVSIGRDHAMLISKDIKVGVHSSASRGKTRVTENTLQDLSQVSIVPRRLIRQVMRQVYLMSIV